MDQRIALLRGINLGPGRRIPMPALRDLLAGGGFKDARTYVQSGNVVFGSKADPRKLEQQLEQLIRDEFGFEVGVIVRTRDELAEVVERNPFASVAKDPKRYQVTFLSRPLETERAEELFSLAAEPERLAAIGRELYAWHPNGVGRSKLAMKLAAKGLGVKATARNWTTVTTLLEMADQS
jgi:uncharacterized protein (DUF1697 family)